MISVDHLLSVRLTRAIPTYILWAIICINQIDRKSTLMGTLYSMRSDHACPSPFYNSWTFMPPISDVRIVVDEVATNLLF